MIRPYWTGGIFLSAGLTAYLVHGQVVATVSAGIDTRSDYVLIESGAAPKLGLTLPFSRQAPYSGAAGTQAGTLSFPPDGLVSLLVTDYTSIAICPRR
jgi:hypothetical protein